jgi:peptide deformylase
MKKIISLGDPKLRAISKEIPIKNITSKAIQTIAKDMTEALHNEYDGIGISAPQIAQNVRLFVVCHRLFVSKTKKASDAKDLIFINPKILKASKKQATAEEGCLSIRGIYGDVKRSSTITVEAYNELGEKFTRGAGGILARVIQHEIDHLDGILFIDKATNIREIPPEENVPDEHDEL